ncbi:hypothetical protein LO772_08255 [Yinghuangia sp. ASG 101]|uniref:hypothetical protein n=1 Tax=Yinghuangia sp. ASG 101 TaxID=2896848 RepID=UPI001E420F56|nr:hypothetical protein [Yinghuangia sp. ASG 101]UGQ13585.1 hypothetical protein LO772_08255 [Yinghuangia sp. ASG 101]
MGGSGPQVALPPSPIRGNWSELDYLKGLYESGMSPQQVADLYGRAPLRIDPMTGLPGGWLVSVGGDEPPTGGGAVAPPPSAEYLAQVAVSRLTLPSPVVGTSPSGDQVLGVPTWLWVDGTTWAPVSATAAVPGVSVTATAVPVSAVWSMGTGDAVTCSGPGTPYGPASDPASGSPDCGYTYGRSSAGQPAERFPLTVTVTWRVSWSGGGQAGVVEGMSTSASTGLRVREVQAVVVAVS